MQRRHFLQFPVIAAAVASVRSLLPSWGSAARVIQVPRRPVLTRVDRDRDDRPFRWLDATFHVKVSGRDTDGRCVVFDTLRPEKVGPPLHLHTDCDEWFFVRDGTFKFQVGTDLLRLSPGDSLLVPRHVPHAFVKTSDGVARLIVMHQPAATMEEYFRSVIQQADQTVEGRRALAERHGMRLLGPGLTPD
jgi:mannose-6-phosphate isomerase-like protein (cupin superfamily)